MKKDSPKEIKKGIKAFNKGLICRNKQYSENTIFEENVQPELCSKGIHYCENPLDTLDYYDLCTSEFAEIEDLGDSVTDGNKTATNKIKIGVKIDLPTFIKASISFIWEKCFDQKMIDECNKISSGDNTKNASSGYNTKNASSGYNTQNASSGDNTSEEITGNNCVVASIGKYSKIKASLGTWITLAEYDSNNICILVKSAQIDGKKLKADTWYVLKDKKFQITN
jgi:hypothetical protein